MSQSRERIAYFKKETMSVRTGVEDRASVRHIRHTPSARKILFQEKKERKYTHSDSRLCFESEVFLALKKQKINKFKLYVSCSLINILLIFQDRHFTEESWGSWKSSEVERWYVLRCVFSFNIHESPPKKRKKVETRSAALSPLPLFLFFAVFLFFLRWCWGL